MSKTLHSKPKKIHISGRANTYGLCPCTQCRYGRRRMRQKFTVKKIARSFNLFLRGKSNREPRKGIYTD